MAHTDTSADARPHVSPELIVGAASPLWTYFGAAAVGGVAFWWMTRWTRPANLEAMFERTLKAITPPGAPPVAPEPSIEAAEATVQAVLEATEATLPVAEAEPPAIVESEAAAAAPEAIPEPAPEFASDPAKAKSRKAAAADDPR